MHQTRAWRAPSPTHARGSARSMRTGTFPAPMFPIIGCSCSFVCVSVCLNHPSDRIPTPCHRPEKTARPRPRTAAILRAGNLRRSPPDMDRRRPGFRRRAGAPGAPGAARRDGDGDAALQGDGGAHRRRRRRRGRRRRRERRNIPVRSVATDGGQGAGRMAVFPGGPAPCAATLKGTALSWYERVFALRALAASGHFG